MNELIKKLKDKDYVRAFGLMMPEEQECFRKAGAKNCLKFFSDSGWGKCEHLEWDAFTYAIKPDYQPEPEFVDLEIKKDTRGNRWLGVEKTDKIDFGIPADFLSLHCLPSLPNFERFWWNNDGDFTFIEDVARKRNEGKKVFARFRTTS
jgi:hypothetical protein